MSARDSKAAPLPLKDLPGFDRARHQAIYPTGPLVPLYDACLDQAALAVIPGLESCLVGILERIANALLSQRLNNYGLLRVVPAPKRPVMNSRQYLNFVARVLGPMAKITAGVANDCEAANG